MAQAATAISTGRVTREALLSRAEALVPMLAERAERTEEERRLPVDTVEDFHRSGLFRALQPARVGGHELDYGMLVDMAAVAGKGCASAAWNLSNLASHHWMLAMWPKAAQDEVWGGRGERADTLISASVIFPAGRARKVDGGYLLSGRWPFCSGVDPSEWIMLGGVIPAAADGGTADYRLFLVPKPDVRVHDVWFTSGLQGTGSNDVEATDLFVPEHRTVSADDVKGDPTPGAAVNPAPLYRVPVIAPFPYVLSGVAVGVARGALDGFVDNLRSRVARYTGARMSDLQNVQIKVAEAAALVDAAHLVMRADCDETMAIAAAGRAPDMLTKAKYRRNGAFSAGLCVRAVDLLFQASGGGGIYKRNPIQRAFRDIHAVSGHIAFNMDVAGTTYGRLALGADPDNPTL